MKNVFIFIIVSFVLLSALQAVAVPVEWRWEKATTGTEAVDYEGQIEIVTASTPPDTSLMLFSVGSADTTFTFSGYAYGTLIRCRVRGKDVRDVVGPYSEWAEWFVDYGTPGKTKAPVVVRVEDPPIIDP